MESIHRMLNIIRTDISQETETSHVHAKDGDILLPYPTGRFQKRTVTTHGDGEISREVIIRKHPRGVYIQMLVVFQEIVILHVNIQLTPITGDGRQHLLDAGRLLDLINIAEKGES